MNYIGKIWMPEHKCLSLQDIATIMDLKDVHIFHATEDAIGTTIFRNHPILVLIHTSWGTLNEVKKIRLYAHHVDENNSEKLMEQLTSNFHRIPMNHREAQVNEEPRLTSEDLALDNDNLPIKRDENNLPQDIKKQIDSFKARIEVLTNNAILSSPEESSINRYLKMFNDPNEPIGPNDIAEFDSILTTIEDRYRL